MSLFEKFINPFIRFGRNIDEQREKSEALIAKNIAEKKEREKRFEFKVGEGLEKEGTVVRPGPTRRKLEIPDDEPVEYSLDKPLAASPTLVAKKIVEKRALVGDAPARHPGDRLKELPGDALKGTGNVLALGGDIAKAVVRAPVRSIVSLGLEAPTSIMELVTGREVQESSYVPKTKFEKIIFGDEPVKNVFRQTSQRSKDMREIAAKMNMNSDLSSSASLALTPMFYAGMVGLDLLPYGGARKKVSQKVLQQIAAETGDDAILAILRTEFKNPEKDLKLLAGALSDMTNTKDVAATLNGFKAATKHVGNASIIDEVAEQPFRIDYGKLDATPKEKLVLQFLEKESFEKIAATKGDVLKLKEVAQKAVAEGSVLNKVITRKETKDLAVIEQRTVNRHAALREVIYNPKTTAADRKAIMQEFLELDERLLSYSRDWGRRGKMMQLDVANEEQSALENILKKFRKQEVDVNKLKDEIAEVDWNDYKSVVNFYRSKVKPTWNEIITEFRYNNMLSNPRTTMRNLLTGAEQAFVGVPLQKTVEASLDFMDFFVRGKKRETFFKEIPKYYSELFKSIPNGMRAFSDVMKGNIPISNLDVKRIPTQWFRKKFGKFGDATMTWPSKTMEGGDRLLMTMIGDAEKARLLRQGRSVEEATKAGQKLGEYSLWRQGLFPEGQGAVLNSIDELTAVADRLRKVAGGTLSWAIPFLRTPMNFAKQWLEYSPLGVTTLIGAANKKQQLAKSLIGSMFTFKAFTMAADDRTTWAAPKDPDARSAFYASGKIPYSIKINDRWIPMMFLGPYAYAFALPAAVKYMQEDSPKALTQGDTAKIASGIALSMSMLKDQTFLEGIDQIMSTVEGLEENGMSASLQKQTAFTGGQLVPLQGLVRYISTIVDPVYREVGNEQPLIDAFKRDLPFLSKNLNPYLTPTGELSRRNLSNYLSPYNIKVSNDDYQSILDETTKLAQNREVLKKYDKAITNEAKGIVAKFYTIQNDPKKSADQKKQDTGELLGSVKGDEVKNSIALQILEKEYNLESLGIPMSTFFKSDKTVDKARVADLIAGDLLLLEGKGAKALPREEREETLERMQIMRSNGLWDAKVSQMVAQRLSQFEQGETIAEQRESGNEPDISDISTEDLLEEAFSR